MRRTSADIPDELLDRLRHMATDRGISLTALIREALEEKVGNHQPTPQSLGIATSGHADTSRRAGEERPVPRSHR